MHLNIYLHSDQTYPEGCLSVKVICTFREGDSINREQSEQEKEVGSSQFEMPCSYATNPPTVLSEAHLGRIRDRAFSVAAPKLENFLNKGVLMRIQRIIETGCLIYYTCSLCSLSFSVGQ